MIRTKFPNQTTFVDPWDYLGPKRKKRVNESWAGTFRDDILPANTVVNKDVPAKSMAVGILAKHCEKAIINGLFFYERMASTLITIWPGQRNNQDLDGTAQAPT